MDDTKSRARHNSNHSKDRQQQLVAFFVVGLCAGIIISQRLYIHNARADLDSHATAIRTGQQGSLPTSSKAASSSDRRFMRGSSSSSTVKAASAVSASTVSTAAVAGALAAEVAAAEAAAVAAISEELVRVDPQLRELEMYLRKVRSLCNGNLT
jgi:hypothetical protein